MSHKKSHDSYKKAAQESFDDGFAQGEQHVTINSPFADTEEDYIIPQLPENLQELCLEYVCPSCQQKQEADQIRLRAMAEMENYKKRLGREHEEQLTYAAEKVLATLLPTLDNLDLALQYGSQHEACKDMLMGVEMTRKLLLEAVKTHGLEPVGVAGEIFTPELHEALSYEVRNDLDPGHVSSVMQRGYKLKGRLLRPAKITISKAPE